MKTDMKMQMPPRDALDLISCFAAAAPVQKRQRKTGWLGSSADTVSEGSNDAITAIHAATAPHTPQQSKRTRSEPTQAPVAPASSTASSVGGIFGR